MKPRSEIISLLSDERNKKVRRGRRRKKKKESDEKAHSCNNKIVNVCKWLFLIPFE